MEKLLNKAKIAMTSTDLNAIIDDISNIAKIITNPDESSDGLAQVRRTGQEMAIRRGQSSGLLPKAGTRSPSSIVPTVQDRVSQLPPTTSVGDILPPLPSGFDELPLVPPPFEPLADVQQALSPLQTRRGRITSTAPVEPSPTWQDKQKRKAIDDLLNAADGEAGGSFNDFLKRSDTNRIQAARLFGILLVLCSEGRLKVYQKEPYGEINIFINDTYDPLKQIVPDIQNRSSSETMESDDSHF